MEQFGIEQKRPLRYFAHARDYDIDPHGTNVSTVGVVQDGGILNQTQEFIHHSRFRYTAKCIVNAAAFTSDNRPGDVTKVNVEQVVNYISIQPSIRGNDVLVSLEDITFQLIGGTYYPISEFQAKAGGNTAVYRIPTARNYRISVLIIPPSGYAAPYEDYAPLVFGYLPDGLEKVAMDDGTK